MKLFTKSCLSVLLLILLTNVVKAQTPTITSFTPTSGAVGTLVTLTGTNLTSPTTFTIGGTTAIVISNTGIQLVGMVMPGAATGSAFVANSSGSINSSTNFTVTATGYPNVQQGNKLVGTGSIVASTQGRSVSLSADGNTAIVGGDNYNGQQGSAWIYIRNGNTWTQQGNRLIANDSNTSSVFGASVALSADGNTAVIGGYLESGTTGAVWIFVRNGTSWTQQGLKLVGFDYGGSSYQGKSVSISADGNTIIVGGDGDSRDIGAAWIFVRNGTTWTQQGGKLVGTGSTGNARQGASVSLSADGNTAIVGGPLDDNNKGAVWVYTRNGNLWTQQGSKLICTGSISTAPNFGSSLALNADGNIAIVGGYGDNNNLGAAWIFIRNGTTWTQQTKLTVSSNLGNSFVGKAVSINAKGNIVILGGSWDNNFIGATWLFTNNGLTWNQQDKLIVSGSIGSNLFQGSSICLSADGNTLIIGVPNDNSNEGAAWIFASTTTLPLTLLTFTAQQQNNTVNLAWQTTNEVNTSHLTIQRSIDGTSFSSIGKVATKVGGTYGYIDDLTTINNQPPTIYYRLQMVDKDGSFTYSKVVAVTLVDTRKTLVLFPNPVTDNLFVQFTSTKAEKITLQVRDLQGKILQQTEAHVGVSTISLSVNTSTLAKGSYVLLVKGSGSVQQKQFVKE